MPARQARKLEQQLEKTQADKRQLSRELELTRGGLKRQEEKRKAEIALIAQELQSTCQEVERENLERLRAEDEQKNAAARQRIQQMEEQLKKAEQEKAKLHDQMEEEAQHYGALTGQEHMYKEASATVFDAIKLRFADDSRVPWRQFGELDGKELQDRGLKGDDLQVTMFANLWQDGIWIESPKEDHDDSTYGPPFIAMWAFKRVSVSNEPMVYEIREEDEEFQNERQMPMGMPARWETITYSAAFVKHMRRKYRGKADALLKYLLDKYVEYQSHSSGLGYTGYSVIRKIWNEAEDREMTLPEMCELLVSGIDGLLNVLKKKTENHHGRYPPVSPFCHCLLRCAAWG